jgi:hypothetical protein
MTLAVSLHNAIKHNPFKSAAEEGMAYFATHPTLFKIVLLVNHLFRSAAMVGLLACMPFSIPVNAAICAGGSIFYRVSVEGNCAYKFALPSLAGAISFFIAAPAVASLVSGVALATIGAFAVACVRLLPAALYAAYILLTVSYDVDHRRCSHCA